MFADKVEIELHAGKGGDGKLSFRHEKYRAKGGPDGGDGGRGGDVVAEVDHNLNTLSHFKSTRKIKAGEGQGGGDNRKHGKAGEDVVIKVPMGTMVYETERPEVVLTDLTEDGQQAVFARGGRGGFGNAHFTASTRQAPRVAELGEPGESRRLTLELKLVADVGLLGLPNAGKSTLLSVISNAKPEIGDYPFTTLVPNLGVVDFEGYTFLTADIPGLIEGASQGKGLGDEFLRHIERTAVLIHLIDANSSDIAADYQTIQSELAAYETDLSTKPQLVALSKIDGMDRKDVTAKIKELKKITKNQVFAISAPAHLGLDELLRSAIPMIEAARQARRAIQAAVPVIDETTLRDYWKVEPEDSAWRVSGERLEGFARRTNFDNDDAVERLRDIFRKTGVIKELTRQGAQPGEIIKIGDQELEIR